MVCCCVLDLFGRSSLLSKRACVLPLSLKILLFDCQLFRVAHLAINYNLLITAERLLAAATADAAAATAPQSLIKYHVNAFQ